MGSLTFHGHNAYFIETPVTYNISKAKLYINDLPQNIQSQIRLFADDTAVYLTVNSQEDANTPQADLDTLQEWELTWDMEFKNNKRV